MSWFDGLIPDCCMACFREVEDKWEMKETALCDDSCDYFLELFPIIKDGRINREKWELLEMAKEEPEWHR